MEQMTMSITEMSERLGLSKPKCYDLLYKSGVPYIRAGRRVLVPIKAFEEWLKEVANGERKNP